MVLDTTSSYPLAKGIVKDNGNKITGALAISRSTSFENNHYCSDVILAESASVDNELVVDGDFIIDNTLYSKGSRNSISIF